MSKSKAPRLDSVHTLSGTRLEVVYTHGRQFVLDLSALVNELAAFAPLKDPDQFATAQVTDWGWTLEWECGASLDSDRVLEMADEIELIERFDALRRRLHLKCRGERDDCRNRTRHAGEIMRKSRENEVEEKSGVCPFF